MSASEADEMRTREEKRREDIKPSPLIPPPSESVQPEEPAKPKATAARKTKIPSPFLLTVEMRSWAVDSAPGVDLKTETEKFVDYWRAEAKTKADWQATWRNWIRKAQQDLNRSPGRGTGGGLVNRQQQIEDQSAAVVLEIQQRELQRQRQAAGEIVSHGDLISPAGEVIYVD
jgi:hypothetical protein